MSSHGKSGRLARFGRAFQFGSPKPAADAPIETDPLLAFAAEHQTDDAQPATIEAPAAKPRRRALRWIFATSAAIVLTTAAFAWPQVELLRNGANGVQPGKLTIVTHPNGASVSIDGQPSGVAPISVSIAPGAHTVSIRSGTIDRTLAVTVASGADIVRDLEIGPADAIAATGGLSVTTDPPGARVTIDGNPAGTSPLTLDALVAEPHTVVVTSAGGSAERTVSVTAGRTAMVVFSLPKVSGPVGGWLAISAPFDVQVSEKDEVIGVGGAAKIMLAAGRHDLVIANRALDFEDTRHIEITAGSTTTVRVDPPKVSLSINARPWADVTMDGTDVGQTPIANVTAAVGTHQLVFRHPQLGERRQSFVVTGKGPNRVAIDLTK